MIRKAGQIQKTGGSDRNNGYFSIPPRGRPGIPGGDWRGISAASQGEAALEDNDKGLAQSARKPHPGALYPAVAGRAVIAGDTPAINGELLLRRRLDRNRHGFGKGHINLVADFQGFEEFAHLRTLDRNDVHIALGTGEGNDVVLQINGVDGHG